MNIEFSYTAAYFLRDWKTNPDNPTVFIVSLTAVFIFALVNQAVFSKRVAVVTRNTNVLGAILFQTVVYVFKAMLMLLLMTCNGWVILSVILGSIFGYAIYGGDDTISHTDFENKMCC